MPTIEGQGPPADGGNLNPSEGGTGSDSSQITSPQVESSGGGQAPTAQGTGDSLYDEFLSSIEDEVQKELLKPLVKQWDSKVTQRFQSIHDQYKPYKELGADPDILRKGLELVNRIQTDPHSMYYALAEALGYSQQLQQLQQLQQQQQQTSPTGSTSPVGDDLYTEIPSEIAEHLRRTDSQFSELKNVVGKIAEFIQLQQQSQKVTRENYELEQYMEALHNKYDASGGFDDNYILVQMYNGKDGEQAVKEYQQMIQQQAQALAARNNTPPVLGSGGGAPPQPGSEFDPRKADSKTVVSAVSNILAQMNRQGN